MKQFLQRQQTVVPFSDSEPQTLHPQEELAPESETMTVTPESATTETPQHNFSQVQVQSPDQLGTPLDLRASVGKDGKNVPEDVVQVQSRLSLLGFEVGEIDGQYHEQLTEVIQTFQEFFLKEPDGLVEVNSASHQRLNELDSPTAAKMPKSKDGSSAEDETALQETPQTAPQLRVKRHREFVQSIDGKSLDSKLMQTLNDFFTYLIRHNHVEGEIVLLEGMRDARKAHRWSTSYAIRNDQIPLETLKKLPGGRDADGNRWYIEGDTLAQVKRRAADMGLDSPSTPAAEGYAKAESKQFPNEWEDGISNHLIGKAVKVLIPWTTEKQGQLIDPMANEIIKKFGLKRPVLTDETHFELLQGSPKGEEEHGHRDSET